MDNDPGATTQRYERDEMSADAERPHRPSRSLLDLDAPASIGVAPALATVVAVPLAAAGWIFAAASGMACDSCDGAQADAFDRSFTEGMHYLEATIWVALAALAASWLLPRRERFRTGRALLALSGPVLVLVGFLLFAVLVDWPKG